MKNSLYELVGFIEEEKWYEANKKLKEFEKYIQMRVVNTGKDTKELHEKIYTLSSLFSNKFDALGGYNGRQKKNECREKLNDIIMCLKDYGIYIGQYIKFDEKDRKNIIEYIKKLNDDLNYILLAFSNIECTREDVNSVLSQLEKAILALRGNENILIDKMRSIILEEISLVQDAINAVNDDNIGKLRISIKEFSKSCTGLRKWLKNLILSLEDESYLNAIEDEISSEDVVNSGNVGEDNEAVVREIFEESPVVREVMKNMFREFMEEYNDDTTK
ncbi:MAG: hypothetical protein DRN17_01230 [Thermoplasmata archaeon]|nr:MAG: hypothetical protein DRN17_01230 [Thermoplasmata archaeon]